MREFDRSSIRSILVVRLYFIGDVLMSTPVLDALKRSFSDASVTVLLKRRAADVLLNNPNVDEIVEYDGVENYHNPLWMARLALRLRRRRFDLALDLTGDLRSSWLLVAASPRFRVGFNHVGLGFVLDRRIPYRARGHGVDHLLGAARLVGADTPDRFPALYLTDTERSSAVELLASVGIGPEEPFVGLAPGANWVFRRWPPERFGRLAALLHERHGLRCVVTGSAEDSELADAVVSGSGGGAISLAGRVDIRGFAAVAARSDVFVANDSGPLHVAASVGVPVVGLFGPNTPKVYAPRGVPSRVVWQRYPCSPCDQRRCVRAWEPCMQAVTVDEVLSAVESLMEEERAA